MWHEVILDTPLLRGRRGPTIEARLAQEYIFAGLCEAAVEAFASENEARAATMAAARTNIDGRLTALEAGERRTRQAEITAEVVELASGVRFRGLAVG